MKRIDLDFPEPTALYRLFGDHDVLLYVGISKQPEYRLRQHYETQPWAFLIRSRSLAWLDTRRAALDAERQAIETEAPLFNIALAQHDWQRWHDALSWMWDRGWALNSWRLPALARVVAAEPRFWNVLVDLHGYLPAASDFCGTCEWDRRVRRMVQPLVGFDAERPEAQDSTIYELAMTLAWEALPNGSCDFHAGIDSDEDDWTEVAC